MSGRIEGQEYHISKNRLETLVDGIFAIAMTLLILGITMPKPHTSIASEVLPGMISGLIPQVFLFIVAFLILARFWIGHHRQFHFINKVDPTLLWINIFLLISIVFVPFSTDIAGDYPEILSAVILFHANIMIVGILFACQWDYIRRHAHLCTPVPDEKIINLWFHRAALIPAVAFIAMIVAIAHPMVSLLTYLILPVGAYGLRHIHPLS